MFEEDIKGLNKKPRNYNSMIILKKQEKFLAEMGRWPFRSSIMVGILPSLFIPLQ